MEEESIKKKKTKSKTEMSLPSPMLGINPVTVLVIGNGNWQIREKKVSEGVGEGPIHPVFHKCGPHRWSPFRTLLSVNYG